MGPVGTLRGSDSIKLIEGVMVGSAHKSAFIVPLAERTGVQTPGLSRSRQHTPEGAIYPESVFGTLVSCLGFSPLALTSGFLTHHSTFSWCLTTSLAVAQIPTLDVLLDYSPDCTLPAKEQ